MTKINGKNTEQNVTIKALEDHIDKPSKDERKDETNVHNGHIRGKRKSNDRTKTDNLKRPVANFSRTNGFYMISTSNILILSTLFGLVLTKDLGEITENKLVKTPLKETMMACIQYPMKALLLVHSIVLIVHFPAQGFR